MALVIQALPPVFKASTSGFEDTSKILLAQKLAIVHILDTIQQVQEHSPGPAKLPKPDRGRERTRRTRAGFTDNWAAHAALAFRRGKQAATGCQLHEV